MKRTFFFFIFSFFLCTSLSAKNIDSVDKIVAVVNDTVVTQNELNQTLSAIKKNMQGSNASLPPQAELRKQVLDQLINKKLQMQAAEQIGAKVTDRDLQKTVKMVADNNKLTVKELYEKLAERGTSVASYHKELKEELLIQQAQQQALGPKLNVSPQEIDDYMHTKTWQLASTKEYHLEDILVALPETPSDKTIQTAKERADALLKKIHDGLTFQEAAASEPSDGSVQGGDLGWRKIPEIPPAFSRELLHLKTNDIMGPIQTPNGFHILRLQGIRSVKSASLETQRREIQQILFQRKLEENLQTWLAKLRSSAFIEIKG